MAHVKTSDRNELKNTLKEVLVEALHEEQDWLRQTMAEAVEDVAMARAIQEGAKTPRVSREKVMQALRKGKP